jgi:ArsR family transcriptional regulator
MDTIIAASRLAALAHPGRLSIFRLLVKAGATGVPAGEIARSLGMVSNSLSANLNVLSHADLIASRRVGRSIIYSARYEAMADLLGFLMEDCCDGNPEICAPVAAVLERAACCG